MSTPKRVLFVEAPWARYGSSVSLLGLLTAIDRSRYCPYVAVHEENPLIVDLEAAGIPFVTLHFGDRRSRTRASDGLANAAKTTTMAVLQTVGNAASSDIRVAIGNIGRRWRDLLQYRRLVRTLRRAIKDWDIDILHLNNQPSTNRFGYHAVHPSVKLVQHIRIAPLTQSSYVRRLATRANRVICISEFVAESARSCLDDPPITVVPNPIQDCFFSHPKARLRAMLGIGPDEIIFAQVGRLIEWKGQDLFVRAFGMAVRQLGPDDPKARCVLIGSAVYGSRFADHIRQEVVAYGLDELVSFVDYDAHIEQLLADVDLLVHFTREAEGFGRVVVEAMASGCGVLVSSNGPMPEIVAHGREGLLLNSVDELSAAIVRTIRDRAFRLSLAKSAAESAQRYRSSTVADKVMKVYDQLFASAPL